MIRKTIMTAAIALCAVAVNAQVQSNRGVNSNSTNENPFFDASTNFDTRSTGTLNSIGKGLYFPTTDLTKWTFKTTSMDGVTFPTYFDGMIVYNSATGNTLSGQGVVTAVKPGFYYFYNPSGYLTGTIAQGVWKALGGDAGVSYTFSYSPVTHNLTVTGSDGSTQNVTIDEANYAGSASVILNGSSFERAALTGDVTAAQNSNTLTIANGAVTGAKIALNTVTNNNIAGSGTTNQVLISNSTGGTTWGSINSALTKYDMSIGNSVPNAAVPFTISAMIGQLVGSNAAFTVNNTAALWNANQLNSKTVTGTPASGQFLKFDGTNWTPAADNNTTYTATAPITLTGTAFGLAAGTTSGQVLKWDGTKWAAGTDANDNTTYTATAPITLTGTAFGLPTKNAISGTSVTSATSPLVITNGSNQVVGATDATFTVNNTAALWNANQLKGVTINGSPTTTNNVLVYDGTNLTYNTVNSALAKKDIATAASVTTATVPLTITNGTAQIVGAANATLTVNNTAPLWNANQLNSVTITGTPTTTNNVLVYNGTSLNYNTINSALTTKSVLAGGSVTTATSPLVITNGANQVVGANDATFTVNNTAALWNANQLNSVKINGSPTTTNNVLVYDGTNLTYNTVNSALAKKDIATAASVTTATVPLTITNGTAQIVGATNATLTVNNTAPLWNANQLNSVKINGSPTTTNNVLVYDGTNLTYNTVNSALAKKDIATAASVTTATVPLTITNGTAQIVGATNATLTVNNTAPLWNANQLNSVTITGTPTTTNNVLVYNGTSLTYNTINSALTKYDMSTGNSVANAAVPLTISAPTGQLVGSNAAFTVNNTAPLWNANQLNSKTVTGTPASGQFLMFDGTNWTPAADNNTTYTATAPITLTGTAFGLAAGTTSGQVLKWDGTKWAAGTDANDNTTYTATAPITLTGTAFGLAAGTTSGQVLKWDGTKWAAGTDTDNNTTYTFSTPAAGQLTITPSGGTAQTITIADATTASNGLTKSTNDVQLGGVLTKATVVDQSTFNMQFAGTGKFSVGATAPTTSSARFEVDGASANTKAFNAGSGTTINFANSNLAYTTASASAFVLQNLKDGATYTLAVQGATSGTSTFTATNTANAAVSCRVLNNRATVAAKHTLYSIVVMGTTAYIYVSTGF